ncbi:unnamed protein product, partial [Oppiella nova]
MKGCLALWDTAGQEDYERIRPLSYPDTDVVLICFSVDSRISFANTKLKWEPEINTYLPSVPIVLVGNKSDLISEKTPEINTYLPSVPIVLVGNKSDLISEKTVTTDEGWKMADTINAVAYLECSAKNLFGVKKVFDVA